MSSLSRKEFKKLILDWKTLTESSEEQLYNIKEINKKITNMSKRLYFEFGISDNECLTANKVNSSIINIYKGLANHINKTPNILVKGKENKQIFYPEDFLLVPKGKFIERQHKDLSDISKSLEAKFGNPKKNESKKISNDLFEFKKGNYKDKDDEYFEPNDAYSAIVNHPSITETHNHVGESGNITFICPDNTYIILKMSELEFPPGKFEDSVDGDEVSLKVFISNNYVILLGIDLYTLAYGETQTF